MQVNTQLMEQLVRDVTRSADANEKAIETSNENSRQIAVMQSQSETLAKTLNGYIQASTTGMEKLTNSITEMAKSHERVASDVRHSEKTVSNQVEQLGTNILSVEKSMNEKFTKVESDHKVLQDRLVKHEIESAGRLGKFITANALKILGGVCIAIVALAELYPIIQQLR